MVKTAKHRNVVGAWAGSPLATQLRRNATRATTSVGAAAVVVTAISVPVATESPAVKLSADTTALVLCGTTCPRWDAASVEIIMNQFITPTHPDQTIDPIAVTTPNEAWPITGLFRLLELALADPRLAAPGGPAWPDEPWWKLSGLFDLTGNQSIEAGVGDLEAAMATHGGDNLVIYGYSQGAVVAAQEKRKLAEQYPEGTAAPDIDFVLAGDVGLPNGGFGARFPGLYIPILDWYYEGATPTDTQFDTVEINRQYDGFADFPLYPINVVADLNALLGTMYVHGWPFDVSLPADPTTSPAYQGTYGDTSYYFFETENLPLFGPLRTLGVPEQLIDVVEPVFRVIVELGYDRSIPPWEPTPARLIPTLDPGKLATDLVAAVGEGIDNARALTDVRPSLPSIPSLGGPVTPVVESAVAEFSAQDDPTELTTATDLAASGQTATGSAHPQSSEQVTETAEMTDHTPSAPERPARPTRRATGTGASTSAPAKPAGGLAKPLKVLRESLGLGGQLRERPRRGGGGQPTTRTDGAATASGASSSTAGSSGSESGESDN